MTDNERIQEMQTQVDIIRSNVERGYSDNRDVLKLLSYFDELKHKYETVLHLSADTLHQNAIMLSALERIGLIAKYGAELSGFAKEIGDIVTETITQVTKGGDAA